MGGLFKRPLSFLGERGRVKDEVGEALVERWRRGDQAAFADLFRTYRRLVYGVLFHLLGGDPDLEDVVQTTFVEVFRSLERFEGRSRLSSWIARIALHVGYHHLRHRRRRPIADGTEPGELELADGSLLGDPHGAAEQAQAARRVYKILGELSERKRTVLILNDLEGVPQEQIAEIVGTNLATVRSRLFYARRDFWKMAAEDPVLSQLTPPEPRE
ncbi:MAG: sigma-70 family RNA polymerase sigma factor [Myxococcota bacterium]